jgi:N-acetylglutamate synthase-like GNAT family acetyltransferase/hypoxanthine phosphoribosyltransferase
MTTFYLGEEETRAYACDLLERLKELDHPPDAWCPITRSGIAIFNLMLEIAQKDYPDLIKGVVVVRIDVDSKRTIASFPDNNSDDLKGKNVLLLDGAIHSGKMMSLCATAVLKFNPAELVSYALVIKRGSSFIPTFWGLMIEETDRAFFLLNKIPNHRLVIKSTSKKKSPVHFQRLNNDLLSHPKIQSGVPSMDRMEWSDRYFQMTSTENRTCTYVLQRGPSIVGFVTMHTLSCGALMVDEVVSDPSCRGQGYGGILLRFADTLARQGKCRAVRLLAISNQIDFYEKHEYIRAAAVKPIQLDKEEYHPMEKAVLYHQSPLR